MEKTDFYYYLHKTKVDSSNMIEDIFNNGLTSWYGTSIHSTLAPIDEKDLEQFGLDSMMKKYLGNDEEYNSVFLFKIPKKYMTDRIHRDGKIDPPVPFIKQNDDDTVVLISSIIQGVYCRDINKSYTNPNFSPVFNPTGLKYSDEQLQNLWGLNLNNWIQFAKSRENASYDELSVIDSKANNWERVIQYYSSIYGESIKSNQEFTVPEIDKTLFSGRQK